MPRAEYPFAAWPFGSVDAAIWARHDSPVMNRSLLSALRDGDETLLSLQPDGPLPRVLGPIIYLAVASGLLTLIVGWNAVTAFERLVIGGEVVVLGMLPWLVARGQARVAVWLLILSLLAGSSAIVLSFGSLRTVASIGFAFVVSLAAVFLTRRELVATLLITWGCITWLVYTELSREVMIPSRPITWSHAVMMNLGVLFLGLVVGYVRTVTNTALREQRRELQERRRAEERLRLSMEATRQGWFDLDLPTGVVEASTQFARLIGADRGEGPTPMTRDAWIAAIHRDDRASVLERFARCLQSGATEQMEYRLLAFDGTFRWIRSIAKVVQYADDGRPLRMSGTHADITEQRETSQALAATERGYRALVELSPVAVIVQRDGIICYANSAAVAELGAPSAEVLIGEGLRRFVSPEAEERMAAMCQLAATKPMLSCESTEQPMRRLDGTVFEAGVRCTPVVFDGMPSMQFSFTDHTARKRADESRLRSRQLEALGTLAGGIAHDFNNILFAIRGNAELVAEDAGVSGVSAEHLREILAAGQRASELVRRITAFARPKEPLHEQVDLPEVLREALRLLRPTIPAGISLDVSVAEPVAPIIADASQVHEAIVNLTTNAAYAIGSGRVGQIAFRIDRVDVSGPDAEAWGVPPGAYTRLVVRDTGSGMDAATQQRAFDVFYTTKPVGEGSGLGLSMVYGTMRSHGGGITVESRPGEGATFQLLFPIDRRSARVAESVSSPTHATAPTGVRVLFVDDEPQLVRLAERTLVRMGQEVISFSDPVEALATFRRDPMAFDVVITDLSMPRMSGLDFTRALREVRRDVPVIMVTGFAGGSDEAEALRAGVTRVAVKAAGAHQLSQLLAEVLPSA